MKRKSITRLGAIVISLILSLSLAACGGSGSPATGSGVAGDADLDKVYELSFTSHDPATSFKVQRYEEYAAKVKEATDGHVNITVYPGGTLVSSTDVAEGVLTGTADIGWLFTLYFPGQFPVTDVMSLPMMFPDSTTSTKVLQTLYAENEDLQNELSKYKILGLYNNPVNYIYTTKPVRTPADLKGLNIRAQAGIATDIIGKWGGTPLAMGPGEIYESIEKGVLDGCVWEWSGLNAFKLGEVVNNAIEIPVFVGTYLAAMNWDSWNRLPKEYQDIIEEIWASEAANIEFAELFNEDAEMGKVEQMKSDIEVFVPTEADLAQWKPVADEYIQDWIAKNNKDFDAQGIYDRALELVEQYK